MYFPNIESCATREVERIDHREPLSKALERMLQRDLRDMVVDAGQGELGLITVTDIIRARARDPDLSMSVTEAGYRALECVEEGTNLLEMIDRIDIETGYLAVVNGEGALTGIVSTTDVLSYLDPQVMMERQQVGNLIFKNRLKVLASNATVEEALNHLEGVSDAVILWNGVADESGILTTKDAVWLMRDGVDGKSPALPYTSRPLKTVSPRMTIKAAVAYLKSHRFHRLVVEEGGALQGVVSQQELIAIAYSRWAELLRNHADELREVVSLLESRTAKLEQLASTDALTGIANRSHFEGVLTAEVRRRTRYAGETFSLILLDIDRFKLVNDRFGHDVGDAVLKRVASELAARLRRVDGLARWGGEEFIILLPHTALAEAEQVAEGIRKRLQQVEHPLAGQVTVSMGVAEMGLNEAGDQLFRRVDRALYEAKNGGRNRVVAAKEQQ